MVEETALVVCISISDYMLFYSQKQSNDLFVYHCVLAENIAKQWGLSKEEQDLFATRSQNKCEAAQSSGEFNDEIVPVHVKQRRGSIKRSVL